MIGARSTPTIIIGVTALPRPTGPRWLQQHAPLLLGAALLLAVASGLVWQTLAWRALLHSEPVSAVESASAPDQQLALERLEPLFGPSSGRAGGAPATRLNLVLLGSFVHVDPGKSSAIIQRSGEKPSRFVNGTRLDDNTRLHAVFPDRVELEHNGKIESLTFPTRATAGNAAQVVDPSEFNGVQESVDELLQRQMEALREQMEAAERNATPEEINPPEDPDSQYEQLDSQADDQDDPSAEQPPESD
jgi:general secretion pathway protein C